MIVPLLVLLTLQQPSQTWAFGAIIIGPIPLIISGEDPTTPLILIGAFVAAFMLFLILALRSRQPISEEDDSSPPAHGI